MEYMGVKAFVETGYSYSDVVGILGELQTLVILRALTDGKEIQPTFLGHTLKDSKKIGVDVALSAIGFQVKNYAMYYGKTGEKVSRGINLSGSYTLNNFVKKLNGFSDEAKETIEEYYAVTAYHIAVTDPFKRITRRYETIDQKLSAMYHGEIGNFLPLQVIEGVTEATKGLTNRFYFIGGKTILPVSSILSVYIEFLKSIGGGWKDSPYKRTKLMTVTPHYNGDLTYRQEWDYYRGSNPDFSFPGYKNIAANIRMNYNVNLNIDYTLEKIITRMVKK
jgi:hypothetical protein